MRVETRSCGDEAVDRSRGGDCCAGGDVGLAGWDTEVRAESMTLRVRLFSACVRRGGKVDVRHQRLACFSMGCSVGI